MIKTLGFLILCSPFIALLIFVSKEAGIGGLLLFLFVFGVSLLVVGTTFLGLYLINR